MRRGRNWFITLGVVLVLLGSAIMLQYRMIYRLYLTPEQYRDSLYVPSPGYMKAVTVGYDQFAAVFLWLRMIQGFAAGWTRPENAEQMFTYFQGITNLDPRFLEVYWFAIMAVGEEGGRDDLVKEIVMRSFRKVPGNWRITTDGASYFGLPRGKDLETAQLYTRLALLSPDRPDYIASWVAYFDTRAGRYRAGFEKYLIDYIQTRSKGQSDISDRLRAHLLRAIDRWNRSEIENRATEWYERTGEVPTIRQLEEAGALRGLELPDVRRVQILLAQVEGADDLSLTSEDILTLVNQQGLVRATEGMPVSPFDGLVEGANGYIIWPYPGGPEDGRAFEVMHVIELMQHYQILLNLYDAELPTYRANHDGACPTKLSDVFPDWEGAIEPLGGEFRIDPDSCNLTITSVPNLRRMKMKKLL